MPLKTLTLDCIIKSQAELNLSYISFVSGGGIFVPTTYRFYLGDVVYVNLQLPMQTSSRVVEGKVIWITPKNALYQIFPGIGVQIIGPDAKDIQEEIKANLDTNMEVGGYIFGMPKGENSLQLSQLKKTEKT